jgi:hypothetical protein
MIVRRKPSSDERDFRDDIDMHLRKDIGEGPAPIWEYHQGTGGRIVPNQVRYQFQMGSNWANTTRPRWADFAIDIEWTDTIAMVKFLAERAEYPPAALLPLIRDPEAVRAAIDALTASVADPAHESVEGPGVPDIALQLQRPKEGTGELG